MVPPAARVYQVLPLVNSVEEIVLMQKTQLLHTELD
jgi:hypothetical protein